MAVSEEVDESVPPKGGKMGLVIGLVLALLAGGGGFFAAFSGLLPFGGASEEQPVEQDAAETKELPGTVFVPLDPLNVSIRSSSRFRLLRFTGQLEILPEHAADIEQLKPRIVDVMNTYLNALEASHFEDPIAMIKLRAQLLRRIQIVTGKGRVQDLLIMEFVLQ